jgi:ChAPs (Chs5p-Arf1p-binding proteins)
VSSSAAVVTYLGYLLGNQEKHSLGRGFYTIEKCYTCSYNAFRKMDLRVEITVPQANKKYNGYNIDAYAIDAIGNRHEVDESFWRETHVCAMLRLITGPPSTLRPIKVFLCYI